MKRRLFNSLTLGSLLIGVAVAGLWVRSVWWVTDLLVMNAGGGQIEIVSATGLLGIAGIAPPALSLPVGWSTRPQPHGGTAWAPAFMSAPGYSSAMIPDWLLIALSLPLPVWWVWRHFHPLYPPGHCLKCGYDLRASKDACPECGAPMAKVSKPPPAM